MKYSSDEIRNVPGPFLPHGLQTPRQRQRLTDAVNRFNQRNGVQLSWTLGHHYNGLHGTLSREASGLKYSMPCWPGQLKIWGLNQRYGGQAVIHPFTPWIFFHRFFHDVQHEHQDSELLRQIGRLVAQVIYDHAGGRPGFPKAYQDPWLGRRAKERSDRAMVLSIAREMGVLSNESRVYGLKYEIAKHFFELCTMRSARIRSLNNPGDILPELFAQWAMTGHAVLKGYEAESKQLDSYFRQMMDLIG